jgi:hypothetical protein
MANGRRPHWLTVSDLHRNLIACNAVPTGSDLRTVLSEALAAQAADGWQPESNGAYGFVFVAKGGERWLVNLTPVDPAAVVGPGHAFVAGERFVDRLEL